MIHTETGRKLVGDEAPLASQLEEWLKFNPGFEVAPRDDENSAEEDNDDVRSSAAVFYYHYVQLYAASLIVVFHSV